MHLATWSYLDGNGIPQSACGYLVAVADGIAQVELTQDSGSINLDLPVSHVRIHSDSVSPDLIKAKYIMGPPSPRQLVEINRFLPSGAEPFTSDQVISIPFLAADNLINRSGDKWDVDSLRQMARLFPGLPATLDHDWESTLKEWGRVYSAQLVESSDVPMEALERAGNKGLNNGVVKKEGFWQVVCQVFATVDKPIVQMLNSGHSGSVSTGGFQFRDYHCSECGTTFDDPKCPHIPDNPWLTRAERKELSIAPYSVRVGLYDLAEISIVTVPRLPNAGIIR